MSILPDWLSGQDDAEAAAAKNAALYSTYGINANNLYNQYRDAATGALTTANTNALGTLGSTLANQVGAVGSQVGAANAAIGAYQPLSALGDSYTRAVNAYYDALGLNGPEGSTRAQGTYMQSPGVQGQINQATRSAINAASRTGAVGGGSTAAAIGDYARQAAANDYGTQYLDRLASFVNPQLQATAGAASGIAGANKTLADIYGGLSNTYGQYGTQAAGLQSGLGSDISNVWGNYTAGQGQTLKDITAGNAASNLQVAQAGQTDASNLWGLLGAGAKAAGSAFAPGFGSPGLGTQLYNKLSA